MRRAESPLLAAIRRSLASCPEEPEAPGEVEIEYLYVTVAKTIAHAITEAGMRPGERLPGRKDLCALLGVDDGTVRRAMVLLHEREVIRLANGRAFVR